MLGCFTFELVNTFATESNMDLNTIAKEAALRYHAKGGNPEAIVADMVKSASLTSHQLDRVCNLSNRYILMGVHKKIALKISHPHSVYTPVKTANVVAILRGDGKPVGPVETEGPEWVQPARNALMEAIAVDDDNPPGVPATPEQMIMKMKFTAWGCRNAISKAKMKAQCLRDEAARLDIVAESLRQRFERLIVAMVHRGVPREAFMMLPAQKVATRVLGALEDGKVVIASLGHSHLELDEDSEIFKVASDLEANWAKMSDLERQAKEFDAQAAIYLSAGRAQGVVR